MSAWHHISPGSCAFGSLPKPRGSLEAHGSAFLCYRFAVFEDPIFEPYILIHIMASKDSGLCMDITYIISFVHILCTCTTISIWIYTFLCIYVYIYMICIYHDQFLYHSISNSQCIPGSGSGQGSCSLCSGTWLAYWCDLGTYWNPRVGDEREFWWWNRSCWLLCFFFKECLYWFMIYTVFVSFYQDFWTSNMWYWEFHGVHDGVAVKCG